MQQSISEEDFSYINIKAYFAFCEKFNLILFQSFV